VALRAVSPRTWSRAFDAAVVSFVCCHAVLTTLRLLSAIVAYLVRGFCVFVMGRRQEEATQVSSFCAACSLWE
jgi:hypothetical protein